MSLHEFSVGHLTKNLWIRLLLSRNPWSGRGQLGTWNALTEFPVSADVIQSPPTCWITLPGEFREWQLTLQPRQILLLCPQLLCIKVCLLAWHNYWHNYLGKYDLVNPHLQTAPGWRFDPYKLLKTLQGKAVNELLPWGQSLILRYMCTAPKLVISMSCSKQAISYHSG